MTEEKLSADDKEWVLRLLLMIQQKLERDYVGFRTDRGMGSSMETLIIRVRNDNFDEDD